ncbi:unnamed protein product [Brassica rapa subsp. trilocularis]|uniref:(rape) hypothetical protein n=1 Tax=Brassica napus TaxID=3708 RepID=A0A816ZKC9_BRANA|nr:unnamed protein product [Brassica napus]
MRKQSNQREIQFIVHQMHNLKDDDRHWRTGVVDTSSDFFSKGKMFYL